MDRLVTTHVWTNANGCSFKKKRLIELIRTICDFKIKPPPKTEGISLTI